ncbi:unnamed protein product [Spirodela intermedia]|uniref:tRNA (guanine-N(7)-)-methyltransferase non-catalytic subunit n=1 Tax=Spirodela intermedia TaxID=51605 RepID=A0A7I8KAM5_SPIIN|nr:unnamed protein product [Spirodela intermedia]
MAEAAGGPEEGEHSQEAEVSPALIAVHPLEKSVVVAIGSELRVFDLEGDKAISLLDNSGGPPHSGDVKAVAFGAEGNLFASAGNDKLVKVWATDSWSCIRSVCSEKRLSAVAISHDGHFVLFADKFGVIWIFSLDVGDDNASAEEKAVPLLGHYCSIITSLKFSPDGQFIASADRDFKIRVTVFPKRPLKGAHEIQSFCLGHTDFVSCLAFICAQDSGQAFLLSGSGDSTVCLWNFLTGCLLDTCEVGLKAGVLGPDREEQNQNTAAVTDLCAAPDGSLIAAIVQGLHGVVLMRCNFPGKSLNLARVVVVGNAFVPTSLGTSSAGERLWMAMGASDRSSRSPAAALTRLRVVEVLGAAAAGARVLEDGEVPGGRRLLGGLQGRPEVAGEEEELLAAAAEVAAAAVRDLLVKRQYSVENRELRKRSRNDRKQKQEQQHQRGRDLHC